MQADSPLPPLRTARPPTPYSRFWMWSKNIARAHRLPWPKLGGRVLRRQTLISCRLVGAVAWGEDRLTMREDPPREPESDSTGPTTPCPPAGRRRPRHRHLSGSSPTPTKRPPSSHFPRTTRMRGTARASAWWGTVRVLRRQTLISCRLVGRTSSPETPPPKWQLSDSHEATSQLRETRRPGDLGALPRCGRTSRVRLGVIFRGRRG
jgi:hypothetical protein